jgi:hypothetical protein
MPCDVLYMGGKRVGIVCTRGRTRKAKPCVVCGNPSTKLCDFALTGKRAGKTCNRPLCDKCATVVPNVSHLNPTAAPNDTFDLCPAHAQQRRDDELGQISLSYATSPKLVAPLMAPAAKERS